MQLPRLTLSLVIVLVAAALARADECQCQARCPRCNVVCCPSTEIEKEKKTAFDVECKWICVPRVRFPWESCCQPQCAWVRKIHVLKKIEYQCEKCKYKWTATCACNGSSWATGEGTAQDPIGPPPVPKVTAAPGNSGAFQRPITQRAADKPIARFFDSLFKR